MPHEPHIASAAPLDAATAFAHLYCRWFEDPRASTRASMCATRALAGSYIADVLAIWDESAGAWLCDAPAILRLETCDAAVFTMREPHIAVYLGSIDTTSSVATFGPRDNESQRDAGRQGHSLRWKSLRPCSYAIGRKLIDLSFELDPEGLLTALEANLDDGGRLRIESAGVSGSNRLAAPPLARAV